jgi:hypothetical protein
VRAPFSNTGYRILDAIPGNNVNYQVSVDGQPWTIITDTFMTVNNLLPGQEVTFIVGAVTDCAVPFDTLICTAVECDLEILNISGTNPACANEFNGSAVAIADFGTQPYTFTWDGPISVTGDSVSGLPEGQYVLTVSDALGCIAVDTLTLTDPDSITATFIISPATCAGINDGSIQPNVINNAIGNVSINWSNGATGNIADSLASGWYSVTITDEFDCVFLDSMFVDQPESVVVDSIITSAALCSGSADGTATVIVSGGTLPYSYMWNDSAQTTTENAVNLSAGFYSVLITDAAGCETLATDIEILEPFPLQITVTPDDVLCFGGDSGQAVANGTGGTPPYTYNWNIGTGTSADSTASNLSAGTYDVMIIDSNNCQFQASLKLTNHPNLLLLLSIRWTFLALAMQMEQLPAIFQEGVVLILLAGQMVRLVKI